MTDVNRQYSVDCMIFQKVQSVRAAGEREKEREARERVKRQE